MRAAVTDRASRAITFLVRAVAILALALVGQVWAAAPSHAAGGACAPGAGVTVVVQWQSSPQVRCAPGAQSSALSALMAAGFTPTRAALEAGYFLCRIDGNPASDPCGKASPANAYWAFWTASAGGSWAYANVGVASYVPPKGSVIGFRFGAGDAPAIAPPVGSTPAPRPRSSSARPAPAPSSTRPAPRPSAAPASQPRSARPSSTSSLSAGRSTSASAARSSAAASKAHRSRSASSSSARAAASTAVSSGTSSASGSTGAAAPGTTSSAATSQGDAAATQAGAVAASVDSGTPGSGGSLTGVAVGAGVLALLGAGAVIARKRLQ